MKFANLQTITTLLPHLPRGKINWIGLSLSIPALCTSTLPATAQLPALPSPEEIAPTQDILPPTRRPLPEQPPPTPTPPSDQLLPVPTPVPPTPEVVPGKIPATIQVDRFEVVGSTVFTPAELNAVTAPFTQRPITLSELFEVRSAISKLYTERGYITSGAFIPPQTLETNVVKIQVIEGGLESINVTGTKRLNPNYVRRRIALGGQKPLNRDRLLDALRLLQLNPLIANVSTELVAGKRSGQSELNVQVNEAPSFDATIVLDNERSPSVGSFRRRLQLEEANFLGQADDLLIGYTNTDGSNGLDLRYTYPLNPRNGTLSFAYGINFSRVIEEDFAFLDINSQSSYYELSLRQPIVQTPQQELALGLTLTRQASEASFAFFNLRAPLPSPGADDEGKTRIWALRFFQDWTHRSPNQVFTLRSQFSVGLDAFDATIKEPNVDSGATINEPDSRFFAWRGQGQWVRQFAPDTLLLVRTDLQFADRALVPLEQFGLGGLESVRGYRQDALLTDSGIFASAEARLPIVRFRRINSLLQLTPFVEFGRGWNQAGRADPDPNTLASVGLGLRWQTSDKLTARLEWGIPLAFIESSKQTWQENGIYFSIIFSPF
jgi:hemolysin activation/secretion protein